MVNILTRRWGNAKESCARDREVRSNVLTHFDTSKKPRQQYNCLYHLYTQCISVMYTENAYDIPVYIYSTLSILTYHFMVKVAQLRLLHGRRRKFVLFQNPRDENWEQDETGNRRFFRAMQVCSKGTVQLYCTPVLSTSYSQLYSSTIVHGRRRQ